MSSQTALARRCVNADGTPKRRYTSAATAERFASRTRRDNLRDADGLEVYHCPSCRRFHVGHDGLSR